MKRVLVVATLAMFIGSSMISLAQEPVKKSGTENTEPADSTKQEARILPPDTIPASSLTAGLF